MRTRTAKRWAPVAQLSAAALAASVLLAPASHADEEPEVGDATITALQETGPPGNRFNMVIMGDGYTADELPMFREQVDEHLNVMWSMEPFRSYRNYINVYMVEIVSGESGVGCDPDLDSAQPTTPLDMGFWGGCNPNSVQRLLTMDNEAADGYATMIDGVTASNRQILALANSDTYGGAGGAYATASAANALSALISPHELSHSLGGLQDEYVYFARNQDRGPYPSDQEPSSIHHTLLTVDQMLEQQAKWWRWLGEESESGGIIDRYEGGLYYSSGVWRPSLHSNMKALGYYYDQPTRERMTQRLSGRTNIMDTATPTDTALGTDEVVWVETLHPVYHELDVTWRIDGEVVDTPVDRRYLDLSDHDVEPGSTVHVTVQDPTEFVRDPAIRDSSSLTRTRDWTVGDGPATDDDVEVTFTTSTQTERAVGAEDAVHVATTHPHDRVLDVTWQLDGEVVDAAQGQRVLHLADQDLTDAAATLSATVTDPAAPDADGETLHWTVDNADAEVTTALSEPLATIDADEPHNVYFETFEMGLEATDRQPGPVVSEFRLNGMGWHHYYGWPTDPDAPFVFSPTGTNVDDLVYGNLGELGLTLAPFEQRDPGYGTNTVEYRGIDAALNLGAADHFVSTVLPGDVPDCTETVTDTHTGRLTVRDGVTCLDGATVAGGVTVLPGASLVATDSRIRGGVTTDAARDVLLLDTEVEGRSQLEATDGQLVAAGSTFTGRVGLEANHVGEHGVLLAGNTFTGQLSCQGNEAGVDDLGATNTVRAASGQCAEL